MLLELSGYSSRSLAINEKGLLTWMFTALICPCSSNTYIQAQCRGFFQFLSSMKFGNMLRHAGLLSLIWIGQCEQIAFTSSHNHTAANDKTESKRFDNMLWLSWLLSLISFFLFHACFTPAVTAPLAEKTVFTLVLLTCER